MRGGIPLEEFLTEYKDQAAYQPERVWRANSGRKLPGGVILTNGLTANYVPFGASAKAVRSLSRAAGIDVNPTPVTIDEARKIVQQVECEYGVIYNEDLIEIGRIKA